MSEDCHKVKILCFTRIEDATPAKTLEGDEYQAISDTPSSHRVVLNPNHDDPKKSAQVHVRDGERNPTDPLRFARVEVWEDVVPEDSEGKGNSGRLTWYGDKDGGAKEIKEPEPEPAEEMTEPEEARDASQDQGRGDANEA